MKRLKDEDRPEGEVGGEGHGAGPGEGQNSGGGIGEASTAVVDR